MPCGKAFGNKLSHGKMFSCPKILFLVSLLSVALFNSIATVCFLHMLSIHNNYACLQALFNNALTLHSSCVKAKNSKAICPRL